MAEAALTTTLAAATVALVARIIFDWLKGRKANGSGQINVTALKKLCDDVGHLRSLHDRYDQAGVPVWYVPPVWGEKLDKLSSATATTNTLLSAILEQLRSRPV